MLDGNTNSGSNWSSFNKHVHINVVLVFATIIFMSCHQMVALIAALQG